MSFGDHLEELRKRLKYSFYAIFLTTMAAYIFAELLFAVMAQPLIEAWDRAGLGSPQLHFANPIEPFFTFLKLSLVVGLFAASPFVFYQLWAFVAPGLYRKERRYALPFGLFSGIFFIGGADLYAQAIPLADRLHLTEVDIEAQGDAWFPDYDKNAFREVSREPHTGEKGDALGFDFVVYERG